MVSKKDVSCPRCGQPEPVEVEEGFKCSSCNYEWADRSGEPPVSIPQSEADRGEAYAVMPGAPALPPQAQSPPTPKPAEEEPPAEEETPAPRGRKK